MFYTGRCSRCNQESKKLMPGPVSGASAAVRLWCEQCSVTNKDQGQNGNMFSQPPVNVPAANSNLAPLPPSQDESVFLAQSPASLSQPPLLLEQALSAVNISLEAAQIFLMTNSTFHKAPTSSFIKIMKVFKTNFQKIYASNPTQSSKVKQIFKHLAGLRGILKPHNPLNDESPMIPFFTAFGGITPRGVVQLPTFILKSSKEWDLNLKCTIDEAKQNLFAGFNRNDIKTACTPIILENFTEEHAHQIVRALGQVDFFTWEYPNDGCCIRALFITQFLLFMGIPKENISNLILTTWPAPHNQCLCDDDDDNNPNKFYHFFHIAPCIRINKKDYVIDPLLDKNHALNPKIWSDKQRGTSLYKNILNVPATIDATAIELQFFKCSPNQHSLFFTSPEYYPRIYGVQIPHHAPGVILKKWSNTTNVVNAAIYLDFFRVNAELQVLEQPLLLSVKKNVECVVCNTEQPPPKNVFTPCPKCRMCYCSQACLKHHQQYCG
jgi:hypothetical protein